MEQIRKILITGATGYVGGHLLRRLVASGHRISCLVRSPEKLAATAPETFVYKGDLLDAESLDAAFQGVECAFYLVHSMDGTGHFESRERDAAENFVRAARRAGVKRIIYLGGLGNEQDGLSAHLRSRQAVGRVLRESGIPTIELRASIVLGAGSISFEMIRSLTEHLPFMVMPKWVSAKAQPISIEDLLDYLMESIDHPATESTVVEVGGTEQVSYRDLMKEYARQRGLRRIMLPVPFLTPWLSSHWLGLVTPLYAAVGRHLIEGVKNRTVVEHPQQAARYATRPCSMSEAIARALLNERKEFEQGYWLQLVRNSCAGEGHSIIHHHHMLLDYRCSETEIHANTLFNTLCGIGGHRGMFAWNRLWKFRAFIDRMWGRRRNASATKENSMIHGGAVDFFHVELLDENRRIRLKTDMRLPGEAWLEFGIEQTGNGSRLHHVVIYEPRGLLGLAYWYATYPVHALVFRGMHRAILREAGIEKDIGTPELTVALNR